MIQIHNLQIETIKLFFDNQYIINALQNGLNIKKKEELCSAEPCNIEIKLQNFIFKNSFLGNLNLNYNKNQKPIYLKPTDYEKDLILDASDYFLDTPFSKNENDKAINIFSTQVDNSKGYDINLLNVSQIQEIKCELDKINEGQYMIKFDIQNAFGLFKILDNVKIQDVDFDCTVHTLKNICRIQGAQELFNVFMRQIIDCLRNPSKLLKCQVYKNQETIDKLQNFLEFEINNNLSKYDIQFKPYEVKASIFLDIIAANMKIIQFMDDVLIHSSNPYQLIVMGKCIETYFLIFGIKLNKEKTYIHPTQDLFFLKKRIITKDICCICLNNMENEIEPLLGCSQCKKQTHKNCLKTQKYVSKSQKCPRCNQIIKI